MRRLPATVGPLPLDMADSAEDEEDAPAVQDDIPRTKDAPETAMFKESTPKRSIQEGKKGTVKYGSRPPSFMLVD